MRPFFSILVPVYNQVGKMDECIASLRAQTFPDFEAIFVDDGSTDASWPMLQGFVEQDERMSAVQHGENRSLLAARYTGMSHAKGEYILFLDSDDYLSDDALECLRNKLAAEPVDILRFGYRTEPQKMVMGGPMMGVAQFSDDVPVIRGTNAFLAFSENEDRRVEEPVCIRCGRCIQACPMRLMPTYMYLYASHGMWEECEKMNVSDCMECGACTFECPGSLHLTQMFRVAKAKTMELRRR